MMVQLLETERAARPGRRGSETPSQAASPQPKLGYLLRTFPVLSETFVAGEIRAVAAVTGHAPVVAAMHRPGQGQSGSWRTDGPAPLRYWRDIHKGCLRELAQAHARFLIKSPGHTLECLIGPGSEGLSLTDRIKAAVLASFFLDQGVDHLHSHFGWEQADLLAYLKRLAGLPYSLTLHAADIFVASEQLERRLAGAAFVATISDYNKRLLDERFNLPSEKLQVVHCGVDLRDFTPSPLPESHPPRLVSIGRMVPKKGFDVLLRALALMRTDGMVFEAELVGDGPMREDLMRLAGELGLTELVRFPGALEPKQAASRIRQAHCFVLACQIAPDGDMDGIPVALMEAMALGRPVVSTRLSGIPELVAEGCGLLAEPGNPDSLAAGLSRVIEDRHLASNLAGAGRGQVVRSFTLDAQAGRIVELAAASLGGDGR